MNFIEKNSKKPFIEIRQAKQFGYSQSTDKQFLSSKYHPKQEAERLINSAKNHHSLDNSPSICLVGVFPLDLIPLSIILAPRKLFLFEANDISKKDYWQAILTLFQKKITHFDAAKEILEQQKLDNSNIEEISKDLSNQIEGEESLKTFLKSLSKEELDQLVVVKSSYAKKEKIATVLEIILAEKMQRSAENQTTKKFEWVWQWNKVNNHQLLKKSPLKSPSGDKNLLWIDQFQDQFPKNTPNTYETLKNEEIKKLFQQTAIFVTAGPSLDQYLDDLQFFSQFLPVFVVPGVTKLLLQNKVKISCIVATDPGYYQNIHFQQAIETLKKYQQKVPLIAPLSCHAMSIRHFATEVGEVFFYLDDWQDCENLIEMIGKEITNVISSVYITHDASVSLSALHLLHHLNYQQIILLGFDFASDGFSIHSKGYSLEENYFTKINRLQPFESFLQKSHPTLRPIKKGQWSCESWALYSNHFDKLSESFLKEKGLTIKHFSQFTEEKEKMFHLLKKEKKPLIFPNLNYNLNRKQHKEDCPSSKDLSKYVVAFFDRALKKTLKGSWTKNGDCSILERKVKEILSKNHEK